MKNELPAVLKKFRRLKWVSKFINDDKKTKKKKLIFLFSLLFILVALPLTIIKVQQEQEIRQHASTFLASINVNPIQVAPGGMLSITWNIANNTPTTAPTATTVPPTNTPSPSPTQCTMFTRSTSADGGLLAVTLTPGANNTIKQLVFTSITNATVGINDYNNGNYGGTPFTYTSANPTQPVTFYIKKTTSGQADTVQLNVIDNCGAKSDFEGQGASEGYNLPFVQSAYAQDVAAITGAETIQLFHLTGGVYVPILFLELADRTLKQLA